LRFNQPPRTTNEPNAVDPGRDTPLPQYEKTQSIPFTLKLQEDARNPGQFQLVLDVGSKLQPPDAVHLNVSPEPPNNVNGATKHDADSRPDNSSPPTTPLSEKQGWTDLDQVPPEFLKKVVPDWNVSFSRSDSTMSTQTKRLSDIKARIKKKGKGYVVRLLKGSATDLNEVAEVDLGSQVTRNQPNVSELDSTALPAELHSLPSHVPSNTISPAGRPNVFEIGTSNEDGIRQLQHPAPQEPDLNHVSHANVLARSLLVRNSTVEEGMSDAETLISDVRPIGSHVDGEQTDVESLHQTGSIIPSRSNSVSSIVKTPTRGLSLIGPVRKKVEKRTRSRVNCRTTHPDLRRSDAHKSVKNRPHLTTIAAEDWLDEFDVNSRQYNRPSPRKSHDSDQVFHDHATWQHPAQPTGRAKPRNLRHASVDDLQLRAKSKYALRLQTNVPKTRSAHVSPVTQRKGPPRARRNKSSSHSPVDMDDIDMPSSPEWQEASHSDVLRKALRALGNAASNQDNGEKGIEDTQDLSASHVNEPINEDRVGEILLPSETEIRSVPSGVHNPTLTYWVLAFGALSDKVYEGFKLLRDALGPEQPVPRGHVRVRWTCVSANVRSLGWPY
jgi:hypothetical protein